MKPIQYASENRKQWIVLLCGAGLLICALLLGGQLPFLKQVSRADSVENLSNTSTSAASEILPHNNQVAPILEDTAERAKMPDHIRKWLEHLEETENRRNDLASQQIANLTVAMAQMQTSRITELLEEINSDDSGQQESSHLDDLKISSEAKRQEWQNLTDFFLSYPPPAECISIQGTYLETLGETGAMMTEILDAMAEAQSDPQAAIAALTKMKGTSSGRIDRSAQATDEQVADLCSSYDTRKWFKISGDVGGGILGQLGLGF